MENSKLLIVFSFVVFSASCQSSTVDTSQSSEIRPSKRRTILPDTSLNLKDRWTKYFGDYLIEHPEADLNKDGVLVSSEYSVYTARIKRAAELKRLGKGVKFIADIPYAKSDNPAHFLDLYLPTSLQGSPPLIVFLHGGGWSGSSKDHSLLVWLTQHNYAVANIEFSSTKNFPFPQNIYDCKGAIRWLKANADKYGYDSKQIVVSGLSSGGHLATLLGTSGDVKELEGTVGGNLDISSKVAAVIDLSGVIDMLKWTKSPIALRTILGLSANTPVAEAEHLAHTYNPTTYLTKNDPPILLVHGALDHIVSMEQSKQFHEECKLAGVSSELVIIENLAHGHRFVLEKEKAPILNFLEKYLK